MVGGQHHASAAFYPWETRGTHCTGGLEGRCGRARKITPAPEFDPRIAQPVASRYTFRIVSLNFHWSQSGTSCLSAVIHSVGIYADPQTCI